MQSLPADAYEVIVTDDSRDETVQNLVANEFPAVRWVQGPRRGPAANRNSGARLCRAEWIVFTDDDCIPDKNWLSAFAAAIESSGADLLEGRTLCLDRTNALTEETIENPNGGNFWSCNLAVRSTTFESLRGFDEDFVEPAQEDSEFAARVRAAGYKTIFVRDAVVNHPARRLGLRKLWERSLKIRWFSLYLLKTRPGWAQRSAGTALCLVFFERAANLLRENWSLARNWKANGFTRTAFLMIWKALTFPILLPYVLWWELKFRRSISVPNRSACPQNPEAAFSLR